MIETVDLSGLDNNAKQLVRVAAYLGWDVRQFRSSAVILHGHGQYHRETLLIGHNSLNARKAQTMLGKLIRYGDATKAVALRALVETPTLNISPDSPLRDMDSDLLNVVVPDRAKALKALKANVEARLGVTSASPKKAPNPKPRKATQTSPQPTSSSPQLNAEPRTERTVTPSKAQPVIVNTGPWIAKSNINSSSGVAKGYISPCAQLRTWSDGHTDYICILPSCGYTARTGKAVATHYGHSKDHPAVPAKRELFVIEQYDQKHRPLDGRISKLAGELHAVLDRLDHQHFDDKAAFAHAIAAEIVQRRVDMQGDDEPRGPLTPEEKLDRIRRLIDDGSYAKALATEQELVAEVAELREKLVKSEALAKRRRDDLRALAQVMAEEASKDD